MPKDNQGNYVYCARHAEYLPGDEFTADSWYAEYDDDSDAAARTDEDAPLRPDWVTDEIVADGFDDTDPSGSTFIRLKATTPAELMPAIEALYREVLSEPSGDDDTYDYWPSGCLLLMAMLEDIQSDPDSRPRVIEIALALEQHAKDCEVPDEVLENLALGNFKARIGLTAD